jgi:hypothetical protein
MPWFTSGSYTTASPGETLYWHTTFAISLPDGNTPFVGPIAVVPNFNPTLVEYPDDWNVGILEVGGLAVGATVVPVGDAGAYTLSYEYYYNITNKSSNWISYNAAIGTF